MPESSLVRLPVAERTLGTCLAVPRADVGGFVGTEEPSLPAQEPMDSHTDESPFWGRLRFSGREQVDRSVCGSLGRLGASGPDQPGCFIPGSTDLNVESGSSKLPDLHSSGLEGEGKRVT